MFRVKWIKPPSYLVVNLLLLQKKEKIVNNHLFRRLLQLNMKGLKVPSKALQKVRISHCRSFINVIHDKLSVWTDHVIFPFVFSVIHIDKKANAPLLSHPPINASWKMYMLLGLILGFLVFLAC